MYVCIYVGFLCMYVCMYVRMCGCTYVRMYVCTYVRMYVCMYVRRYVRTYVYIFIIHDISSTSLTLGVSPRNTSEAVGKRTDGPQFSPILMQWSSVRDCFAQKGTGRLHLSWNEYLVQQRRGRHGFAELHFATERQQDQHRTHQFWSSWDSSLQISLPQLVCICVQNPNLCSKWK